MRSVLTANCEILRVLELDFIYWGEVCDACNEQDPSLALKDEDILNQHILRLSPNRMTSGFVALTNLSLTAVTLSSDPEATISAFDFGQLRSLKLHRCPHTPRLLSAIARAGLPIQLEVSDVVMEDTKCTEDWESSLRGSNTARVCKIGGVNVAKCDAINLGCLYQQIPELQDPRQATGACHKPVKNMRLECIPTVVQFSPATLHPPPTCHHGIDRSLLRVKSVSLKDLKARSLS